MGGGGGYLLTGLFSVNRSFQTFLRAPVSREIASLVTQDLTAKITAGRRGASLKSVTIRLKAGNILIWNRKSSALWAAISDRGVYVPGGGGYLVGARSRVN